MLVKTYTRVIELGSGLFTLVGGTIKMAMTAKRTTLCISSSVHIRLSAIYLHSLIEGGFFTSKYNQIHTYVRTYEYTYHHHNASHLVILRKHARTYVDFFFCLYLISFILSFLSSCFDTNTINRIPCVSKRKY